MTLIDTRPAVHANAHPEAHPTVHVGPFRTVANGITIVRTVAAVTIGVAALVWASMPMLVAAYGIYWLGDMLDGWAARRLGQVTRAGAVLDIVSDRACTAVLCMGLVALAPDVAVVALVFLPSFMVLDTMLSLAFLCWPVLSPNDFHLVDRRVWALNWSPPAKALNTAGVIAAVAVGQYPLALALALAVVVVKLWSLVAVAGLLKRDGRA